MKSIRAQLCLAFGNLLLTGLLALPILIFYVAVTPYKRGFFCDDEALKHPFKDSTVTSTILYTTGFCLPALAILLVECFLRDDARHTSRELVHLCGPVALPRHVLVSAKMYIGFLFGATCSQLLTDVSKYTIGRLRPHFLTVCQPDFSALDCGTVDRPNYVTNYTCQGDADLFPDEGQREHRVREAHLSFVSGHASFSATTMMFIVLYLQARAIVIRSNRNFFIPMLQFFCIGFAFFTALSRVSDYKHHPGDVLAGAALGSIVMLINVCKVMFLFEDERKTVYGMGQCFSPEELDEAEGLSINARTTMVERAHGDGATTIEENNPRRDTTASMEYLTNA